MCSGSAAQDARRRARELKSAAHVADCKNVARAGAERVVDADARARVVRHAGSLQP
jgi:hypothetical protein